LNRLSGNPLPVGYVVTHLHAVLGHHRVTVIDDNKFELLFEEAGTLMSDIRGQKHLVADNWYVAGWFQERLADQGDSTLHCNHAIGTACQSLEL